MDWMDEMGDDEFRCGKCGGQTSCKRTGLCYECRERKQARSLKREARAATMRAEYLRRSKGLVPA